MDSSSRLDMTSEAAWRWVLGEKVYPGLHEDSEHPRSWRSDGAVTTDVAAFLDIYAPLRRSGSVTTLAHLGQSIDGYVAKHDGDSRGLSDAENIAHLHRLRALFDAVVVGGTTAQTDDPRLTTRLVQGPSPVRVVIDPELKTCPTLRLYSDRQADTIIVCASEAPRKSYPEATRICRVEAREQTFLQASNAILRALGLSRVFIEGGGRLVSAWLAQSLLDRLHVTVAPIFIGSGVRGLAAQPLQNFAHCKRMNVTSHAMGRDVMFDFAL